MAQAQLVKDTNFDLTLLDRYEILDVDSVNGKVKIIDDNNKVIWVDMDCFKVV